MKKWKKSSFPSKKFTTSMNLEILHTDLSGPTKERSFYSESYFMVLVDVFSRMIWVAFSREKSEAFEKFNLFKNRFEN